MFTTVNRKAQSVLGAILILMLLLAGISPVQADDGDAPAPFVETQLVDLDADSRLPAQAHDAGNNPQPGPPEGTIPAPAANDAPRDAQERGGDRPHAVPNELIVQFRDRSAFQNDVAHRNVGQVLDETPGLNARLLRVPDVQAAIAALKRNPNVLLVAENAMLEPAFDPNDPYYASQWHLKEWGGTTRGSNLRNAWNLTAGYRYARIVIIDTGLDYNHPDLKGKNPTGYNFVDKNTNFYDCAGHGTSVAGIAAASTNNGAGVAGADMWANIYVAKVSSGCTGKMPAWAVTKAIDVTSGWSGTKVINLSLGAYVSGTVDCTRLPCWSQDGINYMNSAVQAARSRNVVVVAAAGNHETKVAMYPAALYGVLGVGATDPKGYRVTRSTWGWGSNWGSPNVDVTAPGEKIYTTKTGYLGGGYTSSFNGTSSSAPLVAGIAMLVRSRYTTESEGTIRARIQRGSWNPQRSCWNCYSDNYGYGVVNAYYAAR